MFDPMPVKFPYPVDTSKHYLVVKKDDGTVFDRDYPYVDRSKRFMAGYLFTRALLYAIVFPLARIRLGLRVEGREILKKNRELIKKGVVSVSNHVHMWDYICVMSAVRPFRTNILAWDKNISGENGRMIRHVGGIPIPEGDVSAKRAFLVSIKKLLESGGWLHLCAEGSMWEYYAPIRPFKRGFAFFSCRFDKPVIPMAFSYREPGWLRKNIFHQLARFTLRIGEPIFPDKSLPEGERETDLALRCHDEVCRLAGIDPKENIYEPIYNDSKRIDYYTDTYGIGYRGSW